MGFNTFNPQRVPLSAPVRVPAKAGIKYKGTVPYSHGRLARLNAKLDHAKQDRADDFARKHPSTPRQIHTLRVKCCKCNDMQSCPHVRGLVYRTTGKVLDTPAAYKFWIASGGVEHLPHPVFNPDEYRAMMVPALPHRPTNREAGFKRGARYQIWRPLGHYELCPKCGLKDCKC